MRSDRQADSQTESGNRKPEGQADNQPDLDDLLLLARQILKGWTRACPALDGQVNALFSEDSFGVLIENTLTPAEVVLAQKPDGQALMQRYLKELAAQIMPELVEAVEATLKRPVTGTEITPDPGLDWIVLRFNLARTDL